MKKRQELTYKKGIGAKAYLDRRGETGKALE